MSSISSPVEYVPQVENLCRCPSGQLYQSRRAAFSGELGLNAQGDGFVPHWAVIGVVQMVYSGLVESFSQSVVVVKLECDAEVDLLGIGSLEVVFLWDELWNNRSRCSVT